MLSVDAATAEIEGATDQDWASGSLVGGQPVTQSGPDLLRRSNWIKEEINKSQQCTDGSPPSSASKACRRLCFSSNPIPGTTGGSAALATIVVLSP